MSLSMSLRPLWVPLAWVVVLTGCSGGVELGADASSDAGAADAPNTNEAATDGGPSPGDSASDAAPLPPMGCITDTSAGDHQFTCDGFVYDVSVPPACATGGCGLVLDVHGATMSGKMEDDNTNMRALGAQHGFVVVQPNANPSPPASSWNPATDDDKVFAVLQLAISVWKIDPKRVHMTGFSQGGMMTFRFLCKHADVFASVAPGAGTGCSFTNGDTPSVEVPVLYMHGTKDAILSFAALAIPQRNAVIAGWNTDQGTVIASDANYTRTRYLTTSGTPFEFIQHDYAAATPILGGHCYPGSTDPGGQQGQLFPFGCVGPNAFDWGDEVMSFFLAHPKS
jgi:polyhydroxybutyrate depolymerase